MDYYPVPDRTLDPAKALPTLPGSSSSRCPQAPGLAPETLLLIGAGD